MSPKRLKVAGEGSRTNALFVPLPVRMQINRS